jgi:hypothetical protein
VRKTKHFKGKHRPFKPTCVFNKIYTVKIYRKSPDMENKSNTKYFLVKDASRIKTQAKIEEALSSSYRSGHRSVLSFTIAPIPVSSLMLFLVEPCYSL